MNEDKIKKLEDKIQKAKAIYINELAKKIKQNPPQKMDDTAVKMFNELDRID